MHTCCCCTHDAYQLVDLLQASTYEVEELDDDSHEMLDHLCGISVDDNEYDAMVEVLMHMLHPNAGARASVSQVLQSPLFAGY